MARGKKSPVWLVFCRRVSDDKIVTFDIFSHPSFLKDVRKRRRTCTDRGDFREALRRSLFYYFGGKMEYEVIIGPLHNSAEGIKVDVYTQVMNNFDVFEEYVWNMMMPCFAEDSSASVDCAI